jgi:hypothetical protein
MSTVSNENDVKSTNQWADDLTGVKSAINQFVEAKRGIANQLDKGKKKDILKKAVK